MPVTSLQAGHIKMDQIGSQNLVLEVKQTSECNKKERDSQIY